MIRGFVCAKGKISSNVTHYINISITCIYRKIVFNFSANLTSIGNKTHSLLNLYLINVKMLMKNDAIINQLVFILCETLILYVFIQIWILFLLLIFAVRTSASDISSFIQEIFFIRWILDSLSAIMQHFFNHSPSFELQKIFFTETKYLVELKLLLTMHSSYHVNPYSIYH